MLPLKPRQCLLLVSDNLLTVEGGGLWLDNVYLKAHVAANSPPETTFVIVGLLPNDLAISDPNEPTPRVFVTNTTFQALPGRSYEAVAAGIGALQVYMGGAQPRQPRMASTRAIFIAIC